MAKKAKKAKAYTIMVMGDGWLPHSKRIGLIKEKLIKRQAATIGRIIHNNKIGYAVTAADTKNLEGVWSFLHAIMDEIEELA